MKYDEKYPHAREFDEPEECLGLATDTCPCWHCGSTTRWVDLDFLAFLCSEECREAETKEYNAACKSCTKP